MISPFPLIGSSWSFIRKHPVLKAISFWFFVLPIFAMNLLARLVQEMPEVTDPPSLIAIVVLMAAISIVPVWGTACVLVVGKRILQNNAGRTRTSMRAVARQGSRFILPLILTGLLRGCITLLWTLLLIIPGIIYSLSTSFYAVIVVCGGRFYRPALQASKAVLKGQWWRGVLSLIVLGIVIFLPVGVFSLIELFASTIQIGVVVDLLNSIVMSIATILFLLAAVGLYGKLKRGVVRE